MTRLQLFIAWFHSIVSIILCHFWSQSSWPLIALTFLIFLWSDLQAWLIGWLVIMNLSKMCKEIKPLVVSFSALSTNPWFHPSMCYMMSFIIRLEAEKSWAFVAPIFGINLCKQRRSGRILESTNTILMYNRHRMILSVNMLFLWK